MDLPQSEVQQDEILQKSWDVVWKALEQWNTLHQKHLQAAIVLIVLILDQ